MRSQGSTRRMDALSAADTTPDPADCPRCGDTLPLDGCCDCRGSDRDPSHLRGLKHDRVLTRYGFKRLYDADQVPEIERRQYTTTHLGWTRNGGQS